MRTAIRLVLLAAAAAALAGCHDAFSYGGGFGYGTSRPDLGIRYVIKPQDHHHHGPHHRPFHGYHPYGCPWW